MSNSILTVNGYLTANGCLTVNCNLTVTVIFYFSGETHVIENMLIYISLLMIHMQNSY